MWDLRGRLGSDETGSKLVFIVCVQLNRASAVHFNIKNSKYNVFLVFRRPKYIFQKPWLQTNHPQQVLIL